MRRESVRDRLKDETGQNLVEFALVVPLLLILVFGIAEFGRAWMTQNILTGAAREASRLGVIRAPYGGKSVAESRGYQILTSAGITTGATVVVEELNPGTEYGPVTATVSYEFPVLVVGFIPGLDCSTIPLSSTTTMRREY